MRLGRGASTSRMEAGERKANPGAKEVGALIDALLESSSHRV